MVIDMDYIKTIPFTEEELIELDKDNNKDKITIDYHNSKYKEQAFLIYLYNCRFKEITIDNVNENEADALSYAYIKSNRIINSFQVNIYVIQSLLNKDEKFDFLLPIIPVISNYITNENSIQFSKESVKYENVGYNISSLFNEPEILNVVNIYGNNMHSDLEKAFLDKCKYYILNNINIFSLIHIFK